MSRITREFSEVTQASSQSVVETNKQVTTSSSTRLVPGRSQYDEDVEIHDSVDMVVGSEDFEAADEIVEDGSLCRSDPFFCVAFGVNSQIGGSPVFVSSVFLSAKQKCPE